MSDLPPPFVLSLVVADEITIDPKTHRAAANGIFFEIVQQLPVRLTFSVLVTVTEVRRMEAISLSILDPDDHPIHRATWYVAGDDVLLIHGNVTHCTGVEFTRPGTYRVQVVCDGMTLAEQPLAVGLASRGSPIPGVAVSEWARRRQS